MDKKELWRTEGCVKELKFEDKKVTLKIEPTEEFAFGVHDTKKILFVLGEKTAAKDAKPADAKLVKVETEFVVDNGILAKGKKAEIPIGLLYALKKDRARVRMVVNAIGTTKPHIQSIEFI